MRNQIKSVIYKGKQKYQINIPGKGGGRSKQVGDQNKGRDQNKGSVIHLMTSHTFFVQNLLHSSFHFIVKTQKLGKGSWLRPFLYQWGSDEIYCLTDFDI